MRALALVIRLPGLDVCIVGRGGWANRPRRSTARRCAAPSRPCGCPRSPLWGTRPISLTDLVADVRAVHHRSGSWWADRRDVLRLVDDLSVRLASGLTNRTRLAGERLFRTADRLVTGVGAVLEARRHLTDRLAAQLDALSPLRVLGRGYALPLADDGRVLKTDGRLHPPAKVSVASQRRRGSRPSGGIAK